MVNRSCAFLCELIEFSNREFLCPNGFVFLLMGSAGTGCTEFRVFPRERTDPEVARVAAEGLFPIVLRLEARLALF